jgi:hypothetical protein
MVKKLSLMLGMILMFNSVQAFDFPGPLPGTIDFFNLFMQKFEVASGAIKNQALNAQCAGLTDENRAILGDSSSVTGEPSIKQPNTGFWEWYVSCLHEKLIPMELPSISVLNEKLMKKYIGPKATAFIKAQAKNPGFDSNTLVWKDLTPELREDVALTMVDSIVGLQIIEEFGFYRKIYVQRFIKGIEKNELKTGKPFKFPMALRVLTLMVFTSNEFLTF